MSGKNDEFDSESSNSQRFSRISRMKASDIYGSPVPKQVLRHPLNYFMEPEIPRGFSNVKPSINFQDTFEIASDFSFSKRSDLSEGQDSTPLFSMRADSQSLKENLCTDNSLLNFSSRIIRTTEKHPIFDDLG